MQQVAPKENFDSDQFLIDLEESFKAVKEHPENFRDGLAPVYGMAAEMPDRSMVGQLMSSYLDVLYKV